MGNSILVIDDNSAYCDWLERLLTDHDFCVHKAHAFEVALAALKSSPRLGHVISEVRIGSQSLSEQLGAIAQVVPLCRCVVVTGWPSVAGAVYFTRRGLGGYFAKPPAPQLLVQTLKGEPAADCAADAPSWPSLDRTVWEYLSQVYVSTGSISEAARRLGLDRRSLRRMLAKYPPSR